MFRFAIRLLVLIGLIVGSVVVLAAPDEPEAVANAGWEEMGTGSASGGGVSSNSGWSIDPALAFGSDSKPLVVWSDNTSGNYEIYVRRWNGTTWAEIGANSASGPGISSNVDSSIDPDIAVGLPGSYFVAWSNLVGGNNFELYVRRWNGSSWVEMPVGSASGGGISNNSSQSLFPSLAIKPDGSPIIAWEDETNSTNGEIFVRQWNGLNWSEIGIDSAVGGGISNNSGRSISPDLAIGTDGMPAVAWADTTSGNAEIYVKRWNGSSWVEIGTGSASNGGISRNSGFSSEPSLAFTFNGKPVVAWQDTSSGINAIYVKRWNGTAWVEMGSGSASNGGISGNASHSVSPSLAMDPNGAPLVAWANNTTDSRQIYVKRWNGVAWVEIDSGSASNDGVSNSSKQSNIPSLSVDKRSGQPVVAWQSGTLDTGLDIYLRQHAPLSLGRIYTPMTTFQTCSLNGGEMEPNNNSVQANGPLCSSRAYTGLPTDRFDVFFFEAAAGPITTNLTNHTGSGVQLQLHHQTITTNPIALDVNGADGYRVEVPNAPTGRYYVVISTLAPDPDATTRYQLTTSFNMSR